MAFGIIFLRNTIRRFRMVWVCWFLAAIALLVLPRARAGIDSVTLRLQAASSSSASSASSPTTSVAVTSPLSSSPSAALSSSDEYNEATTTTAPPSSSMDNLLFWSSYECNHDAAMLNLGPLDSFLRGEEQQHEDDEENVVTFIMNMLMNNIPRGGGFFGRKSTADAAVIASDNSSSTTTTATSLISTNSSTSLSFSSTSSLETDTEIVAPRIRILEVEKPSSSSSNKKWNWGKEEQQQQSQPKKSYRFSLFQKDDGSETDPDGIPTRYILMHPDRRDLSIKSLKSTLEWRKENDIDGILEKPQKKFDICKAVFPHAFLGRDLKHDRVIFIQRPAFINIELAKKNGLTQDELLLHYIYVNEYLWQIIEKDDALSTMTSIIDLTGLRFSVLSKREIVSFLQTFVTTMDSHYPQRAHKTFLLNAPGWFQTIYSLVSPLMRETTKSKIHILSRGKVQDDTLQEYLGLDMMNELLPPVFQSTYTGPGNMDLLQPMPIASENTDLEKELRAFTLGRLEDAGETMQPLIPLK